MTNLTSLLKEDRQLDAAEEATSSVIALLPERGCKYLLCGSHHVLGNIYHSKGKIKQAIHHLKVALRIVSSFNWHDELFWVHHSFTELFLDEGRFEDVQAHIKHTKSHMANHTYCLGCAMQLQARLWYKQHRLEEARCEALLVISVYEKLGAANDLVPPVDWGGNK